jgi:hypothetical protein
MTTAVATTPNKESLIAGDLIADSASSLGFFTDEEFTEAIERMKKSIERSRVILEMILIPGVHFGNPKDSKGRLAFKKDILYAAGAEELIKTFRCSLRLDPERPDIEVITEDYVAITVFRYLVDLRGRVLARAEGTCTSKDKRFKRFDGKGYTYTDAREPLHDIRAMANKRCKVSLAREGFGLAGFLGSEETAGHEDETESEERPIAPWSPEEKEQLYAAAAGKGMSREQFAQLTIDTLGRRQIGTGADVKKMVDAIAVWSKPAKAKEEPKPGHDEDFIDDRDIAD